VRVYAIDPHEGDGGDQRLIVIPTFDEFKKNIANAEAENIVIPIVKTSCASVAPL